MDTLNGHLWRVRFKKTSREAYQSVATLLSVGNGRIGIRGGVYELDAGEGMFLAGFYDQLPRPELFPERFTPFLVSWSHMEKVPGYKREVCIVNCPHFLAGEWRLAGEPLDFRRCELLLFERSLDMSCGELCLNIRLKTPGGHELELKRTRFASMHDETRVYERTTVRSVNYSGELSYRAFIDDLTSNFNISGIYQDTTDGNDHEYIRLYDTLRRERCSGGELLLARGRVDGQTAAFFTGLGGSDIECGPSKASFALAPGESRTFERLCMFENSTFCARPFEALSRRAQSIRIDYDAAKRESDKVWSGLWDTSDVVIDGDDTAQLSIRHGLYMLLISACRSSDRVSVPAKGLTGEGYRGMIFWDTDIHMLPFFIHTQPDIARNIVGFRYNTLEGARIKAAKYGQRGASFPWETGMSGNEECEDFLKLLTHQLHITSDVVYAMHSYVQASGDTEFLFEKAAECFLEAARFWASKGYERGGVFHIPDASGPDELHLECTNSAYINNMAAFTMRAACEAAERMRVECPERLQALLARIGMDAAELSSFVQIQNTIKTMQRGDGVYEQCEGFFELEDTIVFEDDPGHVPAHTQTVKQADVIMLLFLLPRLAGYEELLANWAYYEPRTTHTSSLSFGVHGIVASRLGLADKADYYLGKSLRIDLDNIEGGCGDGAHLAAYGMSYSAIINGICGVRLDEGRLYIAPKLPQNWRLVRFSLNHGGVRLRFSISQSSISASASGGSAEFEFDGGLVRLHDAETIQIEARSCWSHETQ